MPPIPEDHSDPPAGGSAAFRSQRQAWPPPPEVNTCRPSGKRWSEFTVCADRQAEQRLSGRRLEAGDVLEEDAHHLLAVGRERRPAEEHGVVMQGPIRRGIGDEDLADSVGHDQGPAVRAEARLVQPGGVAGRSRLEPDSREHLAAGQVEPHQLQLAPEFRVGFVLKGDNAQEEALTVRRDHRGVDEATRGQIGRFPDVGAVRCPDQSQSPAAAIDDERLPIGVLMQKRRASGRPT